MSDPFPPYVIATVGTAGDLFPFLAIAHALKRLGRRVTVLTNRVHVATVEAAGLPCIGLGTVEDYLRIVANPDLWHPRRGLKLLFEQYREALPELVGALTPAAGAPPGVVLAHPLAVPGAVMARELGQVRRVVALYLAPSNLRSCQDPMRLGPYAVPAWVPMAWRRGLWRIAERRLIDPAALPGVNGARAQRGLAPIPSFLDHLEQAPDLSMTLFPAWFAPTPADWPRPMIEGGFQFAAPADPHLPEALAQFLAAGPAPLVFTPGSGNVHAAAFFAHALAASRRLGQRAVFLTRERSQVPSSLPAEVLWQPFVPLAPLLRRAAALVHHGGIGTTAEALRAGLPQLVTPFAYDQFDNAARVTALGAGLTRPANRLSAGVLTRLLRDLSSPPFHRRCAAVAGHFDAPADPETLCLAMEQRLAAL